MQDCPNGPCTRARPGGTIETPSKCRSEQICCDVLLTATGSNRPADQGRAGACCRVPCPKAGTHGSRPSADRLQPPVPGARQSQHPVDPLVFETATEPSDATRCGSRRRPLWADAAGHRASPLAADPERQECRSCVDCAHRSSGNESQGSSPRTAFHSALDGRCHSSTRCMTTSPVLLRLGLFQLGDVAPEVPRCRRNPTPEESCRNPDLERSSVSDSLR